MDSTPTCSSVTSRFSHYECCYVLDQLSEMAGLPSCRKMFGYLDCRFINCIWSGEPSAFDPTADFIEPHLNFERTFAVHQHPYQKSVVVHKTDPKRKLSLSRLSFSRSSSVRTVSVFCATTSLPIHLFAFPYSPIFQFAPGTNETMPEGTMS